MDIKYNETLKYDADKAAKIKDIDLEAGIGGDDNLDAFEEELKARRDEQQEEANDEA